MRKDLVVPIVFVIIIVGAVIAGVLHNSLAKESTHQAQSTSTTTTSTTVTTKSPSMAVNASDTSPTTALTKTVVNAKYFMYYQLSLGTTGNTTIAYDNGSYLIALNGVMNYPPTYLNPNNYTLIFIKTSVTFPNGTTEYFVIPVYQQIAIENNSPTKFYMVLWGNSPALASLYNVIQYLLKQGIDSVQVTFVLLQNNEFEYQVEGVLNL